MSSKRMDLNKICFFVLSGVVNPLGKELAVEMCRRFKAGSVAMLIDEGEQNLQEIRKEIESLENNIEVVCCSLNDWQNAGYNLFCKALSTVLTPKNDAKKPIEFAFIVHNEGNAATHVLIEPENNDAWQLYVQKNLYAPIALNQIFIKSPQLQGITKLIVNISSSLWVQPLAFKSVVCSNKKSRDMYFRSVAAEEANNDVIVMNYGPGIFLTHKPVYDCNNNMIDVEDLVDDEKIPNISRVQPLQSTLKLINILEEISFISGHDVDYYDTYNL